MLPKHYKGLISILPYKVCTWEGSYVDLLEKHLLECPLHLVPCPKGCGKMLRRKDLEIHAFTCLKHFEKCMICGQMLKPEEILGHAVQVILQESYSAGDST